MVPEEIAAAAERHKLGALRAMVENRPKRRPWYTIVLVTAIGIGAAVEGISIAVQQERQSGGWYYGLPMLVLSVLVLWLAVWLRYLPGPRKTWVAWYEHGVVERVADAPPRAYHWDAIRSVARADVKVVKSLRTYMVYRLLILPEDGDVISVDNWFDGAKEFAEKLAPAFAQARLPRALAQLEAGEELRFGGQLCADADGIRGVDRSLAWRDLERIEFRSGGMMNIYKRGARKAWMSVSAAGLPNLLLFLGLAEEMRRRAAV
jgi:hypothetical protein